MVRRSWRALGFSRRRLQGPATVAVKRNRRRKYLAQQCGNSPGRDVRRVARRRLSGPHGDGEIRPSGSAQRRDEHGDEENAGERSHSDRRHPRRRVFTVWRLRNRTHARTRNDSRIVQAWRAGSWPEGAHSIAKFVLLSDGARTRLSFDHTAFPNQAVDIWPRVGA